MAGTKCQVLTTRSLWPGQVAPQLEESNDIVPAFGKAGSNSARPA